VLTGATARRLLYRIYRSKIPHNVLAPFLEEADAIINEVIFITYLAGMKKAAKEFKRDHASPSQQDWQQIEALRQKYRADTENVIRDMVNDAVVDHQLDIEYYHRRSDLIVQMAIWTTYNKAKLAVYRVENVRQSRFAQAANYKYLGYFMFKTAADESVCELCAPYAGDLQEDLDLLPQPPIHAWCRCEIVAIPTVPTLEEQTQFLEQWQTDQLVEETTGPF
jgi:hypothetical protein